MKNYVTRPLTLSKILSQLPVVIHDFFINNLTKRFTILKPTVMQLNVTMRCNSRCLTCNIWKNRRVEEFETKDWKAFLSDPIFSSVEYLLLCGGEPTIRNDLPMITRFSLDNMPNLRKLLIATNGLTTTKAQQMIPPIIDLCIERQVDMTITISLDGIGGVHDYMRGVPGHFEKTLKTIAYYKRLQKVNSFRLNVGTTISGINIDDLDNIVEFCKAENLRSVFYTAWTSETYYKNLELLNNISIPVSKENKLIRFLEDRVAELPLFDGLSYYYKKVIEMLKGKIRDFPCPFADQGLVFDSFGDIYYCTNSKKIGNIREGKSVEEIYFDTKNLEYRYKIIKDVCPTCYSSCLTGVALQKLVIPFAKHIFQIGRDKVFSKMRFKTLQ